MSYIIEQKIKGRIYLYKVDSYWDKDKKQARQKRTYIGPKDAQKKPKIKQINSNIVHKNYGNIFLLKYLTKKIGIGDILKRTFPDHYSELIALAFYEIVEASPLYLFPFWLEEHHLPNTKKLDSSAISKFCDEIGRSQKQRLRFQEQWITHLQPVDALYYDITSISSYSSNIDFIEWGYNRDNESLPQLNMGIAFCNNKSLPIFYTLYPGSIVDVTTLKNCVSYLKSFGLKEFMFVLDRGFFSTSNILKISTYKDKISFIQPLPFSLKKVKKLIKTHKKELNDIDNIFTFNNELLSHVKSEIRFEDQTFVSHIFLNEKAEIDQRHLFMRRLIDIENNIIKNKKFSSLKEALLFKENNIIKAYRIFFKWNRSSGTLERNIRNIKNRISNLGYFLLSTNRNDLNRDTILVNYRNKDQVEKVFDLLKNELDGGRLRAHSQYNTDARLFIKFLALIIQSEIIRTMREEKLFNKYTVKELLSELRKIKFTKINDETIISEISKKQRLIFEAFKIDSEEIHRY
jgi:transposase